MGGLVDPEYQKWTLNLRPSPQFNTLPPEFRELSPSYRAANPAGTTRWIEIEKTSRVPGAERLSQPMKNRVTQASLEAIRVPTLVLAGDADLYAPPPVMRRIADHIPHSEFVIIPEAGHTPFWEQPDIFNAAVVKFLRKQKDK